MYYIFYYLLIGSALTLSILLTLGGNKRFLWMSILLAITLLVELVAEVLIYSKMDFVWLYHLFSPIEYFLLSFYLTSEVVVRPLRFIFRLSTMLYGFCSLLISISVYQFKTMPSINIGVEGMLVFSLSTYRLFTLEVTDDRTIFLKSDFWIAISFLIFFGASSFFFGIYTPLFKLSANNAFSLFGVLVAPLNLLLYSFIIIGLACSIQKKKYIQQ